MIRIFVFLAICMVASAGTLEVKKNETSISVLMDGIVFTELRHSGAPHVYFYPLIGPGNIPMTRNSPMKKAPNEDEDHPHHRSMWFSHGDVNGVDFWAETPKAGKIINKSHSGKMDKDKAVLTYQNDWTAPDGKVICIENSKVVISDQDDPRIIDFAISLKPGGSEPIVFGDTKEGTFGIRLAETMRLKPNKFNTGKPTGKIVQSTGVEDGKTWGKRAEWCDYYGPVEGKIMGVAIFDHPSNPRHPTWWHVRDYGLFAANPFGIHDFEKKPAGTGNMTIEPGKPVTFRYRVVLHKGNTEEAKVAELYNTYKNEKPD